LACGVETLPIKLKHRHKLRVLATDKDYLRRSVRISRMNRIINETTTTKMGMKKGIIKELEDKK
jgi:hypothetical protein